MNEIHQSYRNKLDACFATLQSVNDIRAKSSLSKFYYTVRSIWVEMDTEMIQCRRRKKLTQKYKELADKFDECVNNFNQWHVMATLMY